MAERFPGDGAAADGFGRRSLHPWEGRLLYEVGYPAPSDFRAPPGRRLSAGGVPIPPPPEGTEMLEEIQAVLAGMTNHERANPQYFPDNLAGWTQYFPDRFNREMAAYDGSPPATTRNNIAGQTHWWSASGSTLTADLEHIEISKSPPLPGAELD